MFTHIRKSMVLVLCGLSFSEYVFAYSENRFQRERYSHYQNRIDFDSDEDSTGLDTDSLTKPPKPTQTHTPTPKPTKHSKFTPFYIWMIPCIIVPLAIGVYGYMIYTQYCGAPDLIVQAPQSTANPFDNNSKDCVVINPEPTNPNQ